MALPYWLFLCCFLTASSYAVNAAPIKVVQINDFTALFVDDLIYNKTTSQENVYLGITLESSDLEIDLDEEEEDEDDKKAQKIAFNRESFFAKSVDSAVAINLPFFAVHLKLYILYHCWKSFLN